MNTQQSELQRVEPCRHLCVIVSTSTYCAMCKTPMRLEGFEYVPCTLPAPAPAIAPGHNPDSLTREQVGEGWRLLEEDEIVSCSRDIYRKIQFLWEGKWWEGQFGDIPGNTYRTRLTRAELRAARGLEPAPTPDNLPIATDSVSGAVQSSDVEDRAWAERESVVMCGEIRSEIVSRFLRTMDYARTQASAAAVDEELIQALAQLHGRCVINTCFHCDCGQPGCEANAAALNRATGALAGGKDGRKMSTNEDQDHACRASRRQS